jgi:type I restriction enzyme, S subunit
MSKPFIRIKKITKAEFEKIKMIEPPFKIQTLFVQIVEKTKAFKTLYQQNLQELENFCGSLSQRAFSEELKLK